MNSTSPCNIEVLIYPAFCTWMAGDLYYPLQPLILAEILVQIVGEEVWSKIL